MHDAALCDLTDGDNLDEAASNRRPHDVELLPAAYSLRLPVKRSSGRC